MIDQFTSYDGENIVYKRWQAENESVIIQIAHGLGEMADYYEEFAKCANDNHITVYLNEARGHGRTQAHYNDENIIQQYAEDIFILNQQIRKIHIGKQVYLLGHSLGTLTGQIAILRHAGVWNGIILTGIPYYEKITELLQVVLEEIEKKGEDAASVSTFEELFASINDSFPEDEGILAWLTSDEERRNYYITLPYTNVLYSNRFYRDFLEKGKEVQEAGILDYIDHNFPIYILGGERDMVSKEGTYGKIKAEQLQNIGFTDTKVKIYPDLRHSILQERNRYNVYKDIFDWIKPQ